MDKLNLDKLLNREEMAKEIAATLRKAIENNRDLSIRKGIYISGKPGSGKSYFVKQIINHCGFDSILYDAGDMRNKSVIDTLTRENMATKNVLSMLGKKPRPLVVVMDEIDGMNSGDKGGINTLIKVIRPKKTKKQRTEDFSGNPIVCISDFHVDKKIKELMRVCHTFELTLPTDDEVRKIMNETMPTIKFELADNIVNYVQGDLRKLRFIIDLHDNNYNLLRSDVVSHVLKRKCFTEDTKAVIRTLLTRKIPVSEHGTIMSETDRTIVGLLWHENIVDYLSKKGQIENGISYYAKALTGMCYADFIDRVTFQKQIWQFNEMSSMIKTLYTSNLYHEMIPPQPVLKTDVRFTKVLTKYSTEYNNSTFIQGLAQSLGVDSKDMFSMFLHFRKENTIDDITEMLSRYSITKLDIERLYRYIDKYVIGED